MADVEDNHPAAAVLADETAKCLDKEHTKPMNEEELKTEIGKEAPNATADGRETANAGPEVLKKNGAPVETMNFEETKSKDYSSQHNKPSGKMSGAGHGHAVARHYNSRKDYTPEERKSSRIFYLRNFHNWIKSVLINVAVEKYKKKASGDLTVFDLACGKGGDLLKWQKAKVAHLVCADIAAISVQQCEQRYREFRNNHNSRRFYQPNFDAQFITADCTKENVSEKLSPKYKDIQFDITSCQFALHYAFESQEQAEKMLENACSRLKAGGYFIGTIPSANEIIKRLRRSGEMSFGNDCYRISFTETEKFSLFGHKYGFHLEGVVDCPEFLVHFPLLEKMAEKFSLTLELARGFHQFFHEHFEAHKHLLYRMHALETYPPRRENEKSASESESAYDHASEVLENLTSEESRNIGHLGTLSKDEWEVAGLYMVFIFKKAESLPEPSPMDEDEDKKTDVCRDQVETQSASEKLGEDGEKKDGENTDGEEKDGENTDGEKKDDEKFVGDEETVEAGSDEGKQMESEGKMEEVDETVDGDGKGQQEDDVCDKKEDVVDEKPT